MILTSEHLLTIRKALADKVELAGLLCFPTGIGFNDKEHFWATVDSLNKTTKKTIETTLINAVWIRYLRFEEEAENLNQNAGEADSPIITRFYELTVFRQTGYERMDEDPQPDEFLSRLLKTEIEIEADISALVGEFRGLQPLPELVDDFAVRETNSLTQEAAVEREVFCEFVPKIKGCQARLTCPVKVQFKEC